VVPGAVFLALWAFGAVLAWRMREQVLVRLDVVVGAALLLSLVSMSRIFGYLWFYLVLWSWAITALMLLAVGWAFAALLLRRTEPNRRVQLERAGSWVLAAVTVVALALFTADARTVDSPKPGVSAALGQLVPETVRALDEGSLPGGGRRGRYQVTWHDPVTLGGPGYGLLNELERAGFDVGLLEAFGAIGTTHRVLDANDATAVVHLSVGQSDIDRWRAEPDAVEVASYEPRSARQRAEYARLRARVVRGLTAAGLSDLAATVDDNLFVTASRAEVPAEVRADLSKMFSFGQPWAVFVGPLDGGSTAPRR
jgi:hypothetical protein